MNLKGLSAIHTLAPSRTRWVSIIEYIAGKPTVHVCAQYGPNRGKPYDAPIEELSSWHWHT